MAEPAAIRARVFEAAAVANTPFLATAITPSKVGPAHSSILRISGVVDGVVDLVAVVNGQPSAGGVAVDNDGTLLTTVANKFFKIDMEIQVGPSSADKVNFKFSGNTNILWFYVSEVAQEFPLT